MGAVCIPMDDYLLLHLPVPFMTFSKISWISSADFPWASAMSAWRLADSRRFLSSLSVGRGAAGWTEPAFCAPHVGRWGVCPAAICARSMDFLVYRRMVLASFKKILLPVWGGYRGSSAQREGHRRFFQRIHLLHHGRGGKGKLFRRFVETAVFGNGDECVQCFINHFAYTPS